MRERYLNGKVKFEETDNEEVELVGGVGGEQRDREDYEDNEVPSREYEDYGVLRKYEDCLDYEDCGMLSRDYADYEDSEVLREYKRL